MPQDLVSAIDKSTSKGSLKQGYALPEPNRFIPEHITMNSQCPNSGYMYEYASEDDYFNAYLTKDPNFIKEVPSDLQNCMAKERYHDL